MLFDERLEDSRAFLQATFGPGGELMKDFSFKQQRVCELLPTRACSRPSPAKVVAWTRRRLLEWAASAVRLEVAPAWLLEGPCLPMDSPTAMVWRTCQLLGEAVVTSSMDVKSDVGKALVQAVADALLTAEKGFYRVEWRVCRQDWRQLMQESLDAGGGLIHHLTKKVETVMPRVVIDGCAVFDPLQELEQVTGAWAAQWRTVDADDGVN